MTKKKKKKQDSIKRFQLRIEETLCDEIDEIIEDSHTGISRNAWIVQAIIQRLKKEKRKQL